MNRIISFFSGIMERMRQQLQTILRRFPLTTSTTTNSNSSVDSFPNFASSFPQIGDYDTSKGNSSSVTKIINGHKVVINETEYKNSDDFGGTFFKVRIIDVVPDSSELTTEREAETVTDNTKKIKEEIDNSFENEIPKSKEDEKTNNIEDLVRQQSSGIPSTNEIKQDQFAGIETFDEVDSIGTLNDQAADAVAASSINSNEIQRSNMIIEKTKLLNEILSNPNAHSIASEWANLDPIQSVDTNAILTNDVDISPQVPFDLSRDTYVNEILARNGAIPNPDAEVFFMPFIDEKQQDEKTEEKMLEPI